MRRIGLLLVWCVGMAWPGSPVAAQELFAPWDDAVDVGTYETVEECQAAVQRVRRSTADREALATGIWRDTLPLDPAEQHDSLAAEVLETARRCLWRFADPDSVSIDDFRFLVALYLYAGWDDKVRALVDRRLAEIPPEADAERAAVIDTLVAMYAGRGLGGLVLVSHTPRVELVDELLEKHVPTIKDRARRLRIYASAIGVGQSEVRVDTARVQRLLDRVLALADSLSEDDRESLLEEWGLYGVIADADGVGERFAGAVVFNFFRFGARDNLRHSTEAYVRELRRLWTRATGRPGETLMALCPGCGQPLGERAPTLEADFWLGCDGPCGPRPTPGRVSLVVFVPSRACARVPEADDEMYRNCADLLMPLARLTRRFPEVEVTVVARTLGYFHYLKVPDPAEEAQLIRRWLDAYGVRAALAVTNTDYWRLPNHDRRRIDSETANQENYTFGRRYPVGGAYLIDQDGLLVHIREMNRFSEADFAELIELLLERDGGRASS